MQHEVIRSCAKSSPPPWFVCAGDVWAASSAKTVAFIEFEKFSFWTRQHHTTENSGGVWVDLHRGNAKTPIFNRDSNLLLLNNGQFQSPVVHGSLQLFFKSEMYKPYRAKICPWSQPTRNVSCLHRSGSSCVRCSFLLRYLSAHARHLSFF